MNSSLLATEDHYVAWKVPGLENTCTFKDNARMDGKVAALMTG